MADAEWPCPIIPKVCRTQCSGPGQASGLASLGPGYLQQPHAVVFFLGSSLYTSATDGSHTGPALPALSCDTQAGEPPTQAKAMKLGALPRARAAVLSSLHPSSCHSLWTNRDDRNLTGRRYMPSNTSVWEVSAEHQLSTQCHCSGCSMKTFSQ